LKTQNIHGKINIHKMKKEEVVRLFVLVGVVRRNCTKLYAIT
jgi:hypothetical protein